MPIFSKKKSPVIQPDMPPIPSRTLTPEHRLKSELTIRSGATQQRSWLVGSATLDDEAATAGGLLVAALASALDRGKG